MTGSRQNSSELRLEVVFMRARRTEPRPKKNLDRVRKISFFLSFFRQQPRAGRQ